VEEAWVTGNDKMAVAIPQSYSMFPGNTAQFTVTALLSDGVTPFNLTGATVTWTAKLVPEFIATLWSKSTGADIIIPTPSNGQINLWNRPSDTSGLVPGQSIYNYVTVTDTLGNIYTVEEFLVFLQT
jgi:hypothetical protein